MSIEKANPFFEIENAIQAMLEIVKKKNKRILISIDEATSSREMKTFAICLSGYWIPHMAEGRGL